MIKSIEATGKTEEAAVAAALEQLGVDRDSVSVEILERAKSGFLGLGNTPAKVRVSYEYEESAAERAKAFLGGLFERMGAEADTEITEDEEKGLSIKLTGQNLGMLIGRRGETLDAIQHLTNHAVNRGAAKRVRISIDAENYRSKREDALKGLAEKVAGKVVRYRRDMTLEPMNSYERHIIHTALQEYDGVSTHSVGIEPNRRIVVSYTGRGGRSRY
ncbi:MAG: protein jag [Oscillospiraceae bacterium]|nr:protein jag [Oscillospiraceae bacterium]